MNFMSYVYSGPPQVLPKGKGKTPPPPPTLLQVWAAEFPAMTLGDTCTIMPNGARVCTSDDSVAVAPVPLPPTPAPCPACPPQRECPTPAPCPPPIECATHAPCPPCPTPIRASVPPTIVRQPAPVVRKSTIASTRQNWLQSLISAVRTRAALQGLGDVCQVYANGARVCTSADTVPPVIPQSTLVCRDVPISGSRVLLSTPVRWQATIAKTPATYSARTQRVCRQVPLPAQLANTTAIAPASNTLPAAPLPADTTPTSSFPSFDLSSVPTWAWYVIGAGGIYWLFFKRGR